MSLFFTGAGHCFYMIIYCKDMILMVFIYLCYIFCNFEGYWSYTVDSNGQCQELS